MKLIDETTIQILLGVLWWALGLILFGWLAHLTVRFFMLGWGIG